MGLPTWSPSEVSTFFIKDRDDVTGDERSGAETAIVASHRPTRPLKKVETPGLVFVSIFMAFMRLTGGAWNSTTRYLPKELKALVGATSERYVERRRVDRYVGRSGGTGSDSDHGSRCGIEWFSVKAKCEKRRAEWRERNGVHTESHSFSVVLLLSHTYDRPRTHARARINRQSARHANERTRRVRHA